jgi:crotonobetainyl-CoA:carnitine CoA-transferase CaiB-like acyl-CoA transferase
MFVEGFREKALHGVHYLHSSETPQQTGRAPLLGEHNRLIYQKLGYSPQDIVDLARGGAI